MSELPMSGRRRSSRRDVLLRGRGCATWRVPPDVVRDLRATTRLPSPKPKTWQCGNDGAGPVLGVQVPRVRHP